MRFVHHLVLSDFLIFANPSEHKMLSRCGFILISLITNVIRLSIFSNPYWPFLMFLLLNARSYLLPIFLIILYIFFN